MHIAHVYLPTYFTIYDKHMALIYLHKLNAIMGIYWKLNKFIALESNLKISFTGNDRVYVGYPRSYNLLSIQITYSQIIAFVSIHYEW